MLSCSKLFLQVSNCPDKSNNEISQQADNGNVLTTMMKSPGDGPHAESPSGVSSWWGDVTGGYTTISATTVGRSSCPSRFKGKIVRSSCSETERDC